MSLIELNNATARLGDATVLDSVDLVLRPGELIAVCGPNGAGKSSIIRAAAGLLALSKGTASLGGTALQALSPRQRADRIAYLPQERRIAWNMRAVEIAALGTPFASEEEARARAMAGLRDMQVEHLAERGVAEMSGGERSRVLLARALISNAPALLADEPIAGLDPDAQLLVMEQLRARACGQRGVLVSLHDLTFAARYADRIVVLSHGRIVSDGPPSEALEPGILSDVFAVRGEWIEGSRGRVLDMYRQQTS